RRAAAGRARAGRRFRSAGAAPGPEVVLLEQRTQAQAPGLGTEAVGGQLVLDVEDGLARLDERGQLRALAVLRALLVDGEVEVADQPRDLVQVVLQPHRQAAFVGEPGDQPVVAELVGRGEGEAGAVAVAVHVVRFHRVEALGAAHVEALGHERAEDVGAADVEPALALPAVAAADHGGGEVAGVRPEVLPGAGGQVADDLPAVAVQRRDRATGVVEAVDVVDRHVDGRVQAPAELPLPAGARPGPPAVAVLSRRAAGRRGAAREQQQEQHDGQGRSSHRGPSRGRAAAGAAGGAGRGGESGGDRRNERAYIRA